MVVHGKSSVNLMEVARECLVKLVGIIIKFLRFDESLTLRPRLQVLRLLLPITL